MGVEQLFPGCRTQRDGFLEALDPQFPENIATASVDGEQWTVAVRAFHERARDVVVMLHDETKKPVGMVKVFEDRLLVSAALMPHERKPIAGHDQFRAGQHRPAMKPSSSSSSIVSSQRASSSLSSCLIWRDRPDMGAPIPWQQFTKPSLREVGYPGEYGSQPGLLIDAVELGRHDQRRHDRGTVGSAIGACEQPGFPSQRKAAQATLRRIVGQTDPAICDETSPSA